jgi:hypothetical protein
VVSGKHDREKQPKKKEKEMQEENTKKALLQHCNFLVVVY